MSTIYWNANLNFRRNEYQIKVTKTQKRILLGVLILIMVAGSVWILSSRFANLPNYDASVPSGNPGQMPGTGNENRNNGDGVPALAPVTGLDSTQIVSPTQTSDPPEGVVQTTAEDWEPTAVMTKTEPTIPTTQQNLGNLGVYSKWSKVEIVLTGPDSSSAADNPNPFDIVVDVTFTSASGRSYNVPAFYDGDGQGGADGNVWKVRFSANEVGEWDFGTSSSNALLDDQFGTFQVTAPKDCQPYTPGGLQDFDCAGRLTYVGGHFLKFTDGGFWIKGGIDDPENFIGDAFGDWASKRAAVDFLSSHGVNSIYLIANNIDGDRNDTWPWLGDTPSEAKANTDRFDVGKLKAWDDFFTYVQSKGIVLHFVLNDDSAWHDYDHDRYYREMIARFGYHPALIWNLSEEANEIYTDEEQVSLADTLQDMDPFDHPVTVHRTPPWPFLGDDNFDLTSIQPGEGSSDFARTALTDYNGIVIDHIQQSEAEDWPIPVMIDETPRVTSVDDSVRFKMRSEVVFPIFLAGGGYELHFQDAYGAGGNVRFEDLTPLLDDMRRARSFLETQPFVEMRACNNLLPNQDNGACFGKSGEHYLIYFRNGIETQVDLKRIPGVFDVKWYNPLSGEVQTGQPVSGSGVRSFVPPSSHDWLLNLNLSSSLSKICPPPAYRVTSTMDNNSNDAPFSLSKLLGKLLFLPMISRC
jgi:hypothetical protein